MSPSFAIWRRRWSSTEQDRPSSSNRRWDLNLYSYTDNIKLCSDFIVLSLTSSVLSDSCCCRVLLSLTLIFFTSRRHRRPQRSCTRIACFTLMTTESGKRDLSWSVSTIAWSYTIARRLKVISDPFNIKGLFLIEHSHDAVILLTSSHIQREPQPATNSSQQGAQCWPQRRNTLLS